MATQKEQIEEIKSLLIQQNKELLRHGEELREQGDSIRHVSWLVSGDERLAKPGMHTKGIVNSIKDIKDEMHSIKKWRDKHEERKERWKGVGKAFLWVASVLATIFGAMQAYIEVFTK
jgi:hypothetical protein